MKTNAENQNSTKTVFIIGLVLLLGAITWVGYSFHDGDAPGETLYFISVLVTIAVTGFLAFYAWTQRHVTGALAFALLEISQCFTALVEAISMLSQTQSQALFWFDMRFLGLACGPVFWLIFALDYTGRKNWLSKGLLTVMFFIPLVTQVIIWTPGLYGLWVRQDVSFLHNGLFWLANTNTRVPGAWFVVHTLFTLIPTLIGVILIVILGWRQSRRYGWQSLLLAGGAFVPFIVGLIQTFNLNPYVGFNPMVLSMGVGALFVAAAIFRFDFFRKMPVAEDRDDPGGLDVQSVRSLVLYGFIFALVTTILSVIAYISYMNYEKQFRLQVDIQLAVISELKVNELVDWRDGRLHDAAVVYRNPAFTALAQRVFAKAPDAEAQQQLQTWMDNIRHNDEYERVFLLDGQGIEYVSAPNTPGTADRHLKLEVAETMRSKQVRFLDFHRDDNSGRIHLALMVPVLTRDEAAAPLGVLVMRIAPEKYLYPFILEWPVVSESGETLLVRRDGEQVLFLNNLRFSENSALNLKASLSETDMPAVRAVLGETGVIEGPDYRGKWVIAMVQPVPGTPWFLVSKMERAEVMAPLEQRAWEITILLSAVLVGVAAALGTLWRQQRLRFFKTQYENVERLRKSQEQYRELIELAPDGIFIADASGCVTDVNPGGCAMLGYPREEILGRKIVDLVDSADLASNPLDLDEIRKAKTMRAEWRMVRKDGSLLAVEISGHMLPDGRFQSIVRDISERKRAERALRETQNQYFILFEQSPDAIFILDLEGRHQVANRRAAEMLGYTEMEIQTLSVNDLSAEPNQSGDILQRLCSDEIITPYERLFRKKNGELLPVEIHVVVVRDQDGNPFRIQSIARDISERKKAEKALALKDELLHLTGEMAMVGGWEFDALTLKGTWTEEVARIHDLDPLDETNVEIGTGFYTAESRAKIEQAIKDALELGQPYDLELEMVSAKGIHKWVRTRSMPVMQDGRVVKVQGIFQDITERRRIEDALRESENILRAWVNAVQESALLMDVDGTILAANETVAQRLHSTTKELVGVCIYDYLPDQVAEHRRRNLARVIETGQPVRFEDERFGRLIDNLIYPVFDLAGKVKHLAVLGTDITERKLAERVLQESENKYRALVQNMPVGVVVHGPDTSIVLSNPMASELLGLTPDQMQGKTAIDPAWSFIWEDGRRLALDEYPVNRALASGTPISNLVMGILRPDRTEPTWVQCNAHQIWDPDGGLAQVVVTFIDVSERKRAEEELKRSNAELEQFAYVASHDLQEPLRMVSSYTQLLAHRYEGQLDEKAQKYIGYAVDGAIRMQQLINDLLTFSRINTRGRPAEPIKSQVVLDEVLVNLSVTIGERQAQVTSDALPVVRADASQLQQLFQNLISNAIKFCKADPPRVHVSASDLGSEWRFAVQDNGIGIEANYAERIFVIFQRLHTRQEYPGTGIGLAVCKRIVERHGGRIWFESEPGKGSTFYFSLPKK